MSEHGFIREKQDIEYLILYALSCIEEPVNHDELAEICMVDGGFSYFDFSDALTELVNNNNVQVENDKYTITDSGKTAARILATALPSPVRERARRGAAFMEARVRRSGIVKTERIKHDDGTITVLMSCVDGDKIIYSVEMMVDSPEQASAFENNFQKNAEKIYEGFLCVLLNNYENPEEE